MRTARFGGPWRRRIGSDFLHERHSGTRIKEEAPAGRLVALVADHSGHGGPGVHLTALVDSPEHVCCRYRVAAFRPFLERAGHSLELYPWPPSWWGRLRLPYDLRHADAVLVQRRLLSGWQLARLRRAAHFLLFDCDD